MIFEINYIIIDLSNNLTIWNKLPVGYVPHYGRYYKEYNEW